MISPCEQLDAFFDGELSSDAAAEFRDHLATCAHCERALHGRMLEAIVVEDAAAPLRVVPLATPLRARRMRPVIAGVAVALAASVALAWWAKGRSDGPAPADTLAIVLQIEHGPAVTRGAPARVGDRVHAHAHAPLWIYRGDHELVVACPGGVGCGDDGADFVPHASGTYSIVVLSSPDAVPAPHGKLDTDVSVAVAAGARYRIETLDVE